MAWRFHLCYRILILLASLLSISLSISLSMSSSEVNNNVAAAAAEGEYVLTLDHTNFSHAVSHHNFLVLQFWAPCEKMHKSLCRFGEELAPEYEKAASVLSTHEPPIFMAKIDGSADENKELRDKFEITGYPTIVISQNNGRDYHDYAGPRDADGIVRTLKRLIGPPSIEIKTDTDALSLIDEKKISIVGIFPIFYGEEFENFTVIANKLLWESWDFDVFYTSDASIIPRGESSVTTPTLRLLKPYDEPFDDSQNFQVHAMENFIIEASFPLVTILGEPPPDIISKYLSQLPDEQAMLFVDFDSEHFDIFKSEYFCVAAAYKCKGLRFVLGDAKTNEEDLEYSGVRFDQVPLIIIDSYVGPIYMKANLKPDDIAPWLDDYKEGKLKPFLKSQPIPKTNNGTLKVVVADSLEDMVLNSKNNVLLDIYKPNCRRYREVSSFIPELAVLFENDDDITVATLDGTANDLPHNMFDIRSCYTVYFKPANGTLLPYDGDETKEDIIKFICNNRWTENKNSCFSHLNQSSFTDERFM